MMLKTYLRSLVSTAVLLPAAICAGATFTIADDGMAVVDGQRTFILGLYENPGEDGVLTDVVEAGINLIHASPSQESLDRLHAAGAWAWLNTGYDIDFSEDREARSERLLGSVDAFGHHPALLVWEVPDEALWNVWYLAQLWRRDGEPTAQREAIGALEDKALAAKLSEDIETIGGLYQQGRFVEGEALADGIWTAMGKEVPRPGYGFATAPERMLTMGEGMREGYKALRERDPAHPVWMNHAPRNTIEDLSYFNQGADIVGCDIYPVPETRHIRHSDLANRTLGSVGAYTKRMQASAPGKPVWMVLQGTGWGDFGVESGDDERAAMRRPRKDETRFMAYDAIVHGARGILYWGAQFVEKDSDFWNELLEVTAELKDLQPVLTAPDGAAPEITLGPTSGSVDRSIAVLTKSAPDGDWYFLVNEWEGPLQVNVSVSDSPYRALDADTKIIQKDGVVTLYMPAYSVVVLRPAK